MRRIIFTAIACAAISVTGVAPALAQQTGALGDTLEFVIDDSHGTLELHHTEAGDSVSGTAELLDGDTEVGTLRYQCEPLGYAGEVSISDCEYTLELVDGEIDVRIAVLTVLDPDQYPLSYDGEVTGGSAAYAGATGEAAVNAESQTRSTITLTLD
ncbi:hypothetical protein [Actinokineospora globicatena]|uniref:Uncharacterized protein n=1 Tax=Actinokineospora globicatena TaxID=103729 RepID=A0A9W6V8F0_9PSEU|nr:hypothetical protein [Actinokineospora globicatena]GLW89883.1 hypothetical protein Aglo03_06990 [Actinokineospora globicatena]